MIFGQADANKKLTLTVCWVPSEVEWMYVSVIIMTILVSFIIYVGSISLHIDKLFGAITNIS